GELRGLPAPDRADDRRPHHPRLHQLVQGRSPHLGHRPARKRMTRLRQAKPLTLRLDADNTHLANLCGPLDDNLRQIADGWNVGLARRGNQFTITGERAQEAARALRWFHDKAREQTLSIDDVQLGLVELGASRVHDASGQESSSDELPSLEELGFSLRT